MTWKPQQNNRLSRNKNGLLFMVISFRPRTMVTHAHVWKGERCVFLTRINLLWARFRSCRGLLWFAIVVVLSITQELSQIDSTPSQFQANLLDLRRYFGTHSPSVGGVFCLLNVPKIKCLNFVGLVSRFGLVWPPRLDLPFQILFLVAEIIPVPANCSFHFSRLFLPNSFVPSIYNYIGLLLVPTMNGQDA